MKRKLFSRIDLWILLAVSLLLVGFFILRYHEGKGNVVIVEGTNFKKIISKPGVYDIDKEGKVVMKVEFDGERVRVIDSVCPLKVCVKTGWVKPGGTIICVPNAIVIHFEGKRDYDTETW